MADSSIALTEGSGAKRARSFNRTVDSTSVDTTYVVMDEAGVATGTVIAAGISVATSNDHVIQLMNTVGKYLRVHRIEINQTANTSAAGTAIFAVYRLTTAGSGGTTVTPSSFDTSDTISATSQTLPSSKGTEGSQLLRTTLLFRQAIQTTSAVQNDRWTWNATAGKKAIVIQPGTANGIAVKIGSGVAAATADVVIEFTESTVP